MSQEIELKFQVNDDSIESIKHHLNKQHPLECDVLQLNNTYYDTDCNYLHNHQSSVRTRTTIKQDGKADYEMTVKSSGIVIGGLHQRSEFNTKLKSAELDLSLLPQNILPSSTDISWLISKIKPKFSTDFKRQTWLIHFNESQIEIALDLGEITTLKKSERPLIQELELELKAGNQCDLIQFSLSLAQFNLCLFSQSKSERGYQLEQGEKLKKMTWANKDEPDQLNQQIDMILRFWQANEEYCLQNDKTKDYYDLLHDVSAKLQLLCDQFSSLSQVCQKELDVLVLSLNRGEPIKQMVCRQNMTTLKLKLILFLLQNSNS